MNHIDYYELKKNAEKKATFNNGFMEKSGGSEP